MKKEELLYVTHKRLPQLFATEVTGSPLSLFFAGIGSCPALPDESLHIWFTLTEDIWC